MSSRLKSMAAAAAVLIIVAGAAAEALAKPGAAVPPASRHPHRHERPVDATAPRMQQTAPRTECGRSAHAAPAAAAPSDGVHMMKGASQPA